MAIDTPTPAQQLEPCPFCGGEAYYYAETVTCKKCGCRTAENVAADYAIATWNRRTPNTRALAALEAVEGAEDCECGDCNGDGVWHLEPCGFCDGHGNFKMVPAPKTADAVEVSRG